MYLQKDPLWLAEEAVMSQSINIPGHSIMAGRGGPSVHCLLGHLTFPATALWLVGVAHQFTVSLDIS